MRTRGADALGEPSSCIAVLTAQTLAPADTLIYDSARDPKDAKGAYKLWRADGSAGGFFTVELDCKKSSVYKCQLQMTCRDNADWDTLSDDC